MKKSQIHSAHGAARRLAAQRAAIVLLLSCVAAGSAGAIAAAGLDEQTAAAPTAAKWVPRKLHFVYTTVSPSSSTTFYSCEWLQDQITSILRQLGARDDLLVKPVGCIIADRPDRFPGVEATFSVLEPAARVDEGTANAPDVAAHWDTVTLKRDASCALIEQVKQRILPLFPTRNVSSGCSPSVEVLRPVKSRGAQHE